MYVIDTVGDPKSKEAVEMGERIRAARTLAGYSSYSAFARALDTSHVNVLRWEKGEVEPGTRWLRDIARVCGVTVDLLVSGRDPLPATGTEGE